MRDQAAQKELIAPEKRDEANRWLVDYLQTTLEASRQEVAELRAKLTVTYWVIIVLSVVMFALGVALLSAPAISAFRGGGTQWGSAISAGFGIADLVALFLLRPMERIHGIMGDIGQITIAINSFQSQVALRLLESDGANRATLGQAAEHINRTSRDTIELIQKYFEVVKAPQKRGVAGIASPFRRGRPAAFDPPQASEPERDRTPASGSG